MDRIWAVAVYGIARSVRPSPPAPLPSRERVSFRQVQDARELNLSLPSPIKGEGVLRQAQDERDGQDLGRGRVRDCCVADRVEKMGYNPENTR